MKYTGWCQNACTVQGYSFPPRPFTQYTMPSAVTYETMRLEFSVPGISPRGDSIFV
jgi:hypothetical protein